MENLYKQFAESVTKWRASWRADEFLIARFRLTFYYFLTALVILVGASALLYATILNHLAMSIMQSGIDSYNARLLVRSAQDILLDRFLTIDFILLSVILVLGFLLTEKTLNPIKENMQKQKRFIADASHDLRTPTAVVISGLEVALSNKKLDFSTARKTLENTLEEMRDFSQLSNNLLDISKYDTGARAEFEKIKVSELAKSVIEKNMNLAKLKEIAINVKISYEVQVLGNKMELGRVFYNILDNAIKFTLPGGSIEVTDKMVSGKYILTFADSGSGIPKDVLDKVFDPFFRGSISHNVKGAGLGLTLVKKIIDRHSGTVSIKSDLGQGTKVSITLPTTS